jgi:predicted permease
MRIPVVRGRDITSEDTSESRPVVLVSEAMAKQFWPNQDPIGKRLKLTFFPDAMREVVGVVGDVRERGLDRNEPVSALYWPLTQFYQPESAGKYSSFPVNLVVRTAIDPASAGPAVRGAVRELSADTPLLEMRTMADIVAESLSTQRFNMFLLAAFAGLALLLAGVGIYSVLAYSVRQRVREIGVRMALGAGMRDVLRRVVVDGMKPTLLGVAVGLAAAFALTRVLGSLVFGVAAHDLATFAFVALLLVTVGLLASALPAWRATRIDPLRVLRDE